MATISLNESSDKLSIANVSQYKTIQALKTYIATTLKDTLLADEIEDMEFTTNEDRIITDFKDIEKQKAFNFKCIQKVVASNLTRLQAKSKEGDFSVLTTISSNLLKEFYLSEYIQHDGFEILSANLLQINDMKSVEAIITTIKLGLAHSPVINSFLRKATPIKALCKCIYKLEPKCKEVAFKTLSEFIIKTKTLGFEIVRRGFIEIADYQSRTPFSEVVDALKATELELTIATIDIILAMIKTAPNEKKLCNFLARLENLGIYDPLQSISMITNQTLQGKLQDLQKGMGIVASSTKYELEIYKNRVKELELHCKDLENRIEKYMDQQNYYSLIKSDIMAYKSYARACQEKATYYHVCKNLI